MKRIYIAPKCIVENVVLVPLMENTTITSSGEGTEEGGITEGDVRPWIWHKDSEAW